MENVAVTVNPFYLDLTPSELALLVRRRIETSVELSKRLRGDAWVEARAEIERMHAWLVTIEGCSEAEITLAVVESIALEELAAEQPRSTLVC